jgi:hypothetical protein
MVEDDKELRTYQQLKGLLLQEGWIPQRDGESYMNGTYGINFLREGSVITILYNTSIDEEELAELFDAEE